MSCFPQKNIRKDSIPHFSHAISLQLNPYFNSNSFTGQDIHQFVFAARYGFVYEFGLSFGPEFSGFYFKHPASKSYTLNYGVFCRYTFLSKRIISPFAELSGYYQTSKMTITDEQLVIDGKRDFYNQQFSYYIAPGIAINFVKNILSIDLMFKFTTDKFINGKQYAPTFRFRYNF
jgi:hypothetical protein